MNETIKTDDLTINDLPSSDSDWDQISVFALSFDPSLELGTSNIYQYSRTTYNENSTILELRISLYLQQRWWNNRLDGINETNLENMRNLLQILRKKLN